MKIDRNLSFSQLDVWMRCRRRWWYQYYRGFRPKVRSTVMMRGSLLDMGLTYALLDTCGIHQLTSTPWDSAVSAWRHEWKIEEDTHVIEPQWLEQCRLQVDGALQRFLSEWEVLRDERGPLIQRMMYMELEKYYRGFVAIPDVVATRIVEPFKGGVFPVDFKAYGKVRQGEAGRYDLQGALYQYVLCENGISAVGSCLFQLSEPRKAPRVNKDGTMHAVDARMAAEWQAVANSDPTYRDSDHLSRLWDVVVMPVVREMYWWESWTGKHPIDDADGVRPNIGYYNCLFCDYNAPCWARLRGHDESAILLETFVNTRQQDKGGK